MMKLAVVVEIVVGLSLLWTGRYYWIHAEDFCRRGFEHAQGVGQPWRSIFYPRWFWGTSRCVFQIRATGFGAFVMAILLFVVAALTLFSGQR